MPRSQIRSANVGAAGFRDQERHELLDRWGLYDPAGIEQRKAAGRAAFVRQDLDELSPRELACDRELIGLREASAGPRQRDRAEHVTLDPQRHLRRELDAIGELPWQETPAPGHDETDASGGTRGPTRAAATRCLRTYLAARICRPLSVASDHLACEDRMMTSIF